MSAGPEPPAESHEFEQAKQHTTDLVLVDSSAWIPLLRQRRARTSASSGADDKPSAHGSLQARVDALLAADRAATTGILRIELLVGTRDETAFATLQSMLLGLHDLPMHDADWDEAGHLGQRLRLAGVVVQTTDLLIATIAIRTGATLLHRDSDFELIAQHTDLKTERYP